MVTARKAFLNGPRREIDHWQSLAVVMIVSITSALVYLGLPVISGALSEQRAFNDSQLGLYASISTGVGFFASVIANRLLGRMSLPRILYFGLILLAIGHVGLIPAAFRFDQILPFLVVGGFGGGLCYATTLGILAGAKSPVRVFAVLIFLQVATSAVELAALPYLVSAWGLGSVFSALAAITVLAMAAVPFIPEGRHTASDPDVRPRDMPLKVALSGAFALAGVFAFYIAIGAVWTFAERLGISLKLQAQTVGSVLSGGNLLSLASSLTAAAFAGRIGASRALLLSLLAFATALATMGTLLSVITYVCGIAGFFLCWNLIDIFQASTISELDTAGRFTSLIPAAQSLGNTAGPAAAGFMLQGGFHYRAVLIAIAVAVVAGGVAHSASRILYVRHGSKSDQCVAREAV